MSSRALARLLLIFAGFYDGILGLAFLAAAPTVFSFCNIPAPPHWGYVHFAAALLMIFGLMFFSAAVYPAGNRNLIAYGMLLKIAYVGTALYHWINGDIPMVFKLFLTMDVGWFFVLGWIFFSINRIPAPAAQPAPASPAR